jgi:adenine-specific DNA-methyltransferase
MAEIRPENMKGTSLDIAAENRARLKQLFPTVFTETRNDQGELCESIDFEKLKAELGTFSDLFESRRERYGMEWPGKKEALHLIQTLSSATLKPCRAESLNFDTTQNLFIEGDNLEVLKLLQTSYYGKVKMIYIDPPYNTGKEFIYPDNFSESLETYLEYAGLIDGEGKKFSTNTANEGRFHTRWLNMIYPRIYLARNLLRDDGVIFISIDDNEVSNLRKLCDEIFGEENFVANILWQKKYAVSSDDPSIAPMHDHILVFRKTDAFERNLLPRTGKQLQRYANLDNDFRGVWGSDNYVSNKSRNERPTLWYPIKHPKTGEDVWPDESAVWRYSKEKHERIVNENRLYWGPDYSYKKPRLKRFLSEIQDGIVPSTWWSFDEVGHNDEGQKETGELIGKKIFSTPKPVRLLTRILAIASTQSDSIILDFFAGSATTAHAVLDLNKQDNGNRKFILVQLPEPCAPESEAFKAGYKTIADIGKERIRRVISKLNTEEEGKLDLDNAAKQGRGFKVLKLDKSNFRQWQKLEPSASTEQILDQLSLHIDHIDHQATPEDLLYEILLKAGFCLTDNIETRTITGKEIFSVSGGALLLCLEESVNKELIDAVIELNPQQFICLDSAFHGNDQLKANAVQTFNAHNMQKEKHNQILFKTA